MKNCKLFISSVLVFLSIGFPFPISGMQKKQNGDDMYKLGLVQYHEYIKNCDMEHRKHAKCYLEESANCNHPDAQFMLRVLNHYGIGVPQNESKALAHYQQSAAQGHPHAKNTLEAFRNIHAFRTGNFS